MIWTTSSERLKRIRGGRTLSRSTRCVRSASGDVCRYKSILTGSDGDIRVIIQSPEGGILNALMLREQRPPVLSSKPLIELGEDYAVIRGAIADPAKGLVEMRCYGTFDVFQLSSES